MIIKLKDFALTGEFGPVSIGMDKDAVIRLLGEPGDHQDFRTGFSGIAYGWYEFFFDGNDALDAIQNDHCCKVDPAACEFKNSHFEVDPWVFRSPQWHTFSTMQQQLLEEKIAFQLKDYFGRRKIFLESGVYLDFDDEGDDPDIIGLRYYSRHKSGN